MKDEIIIKTIMDTEISVLEEFVKKVEDSPKVLEDDKFVSRANFDILKGHLGTLKKMRETGWRNWQMMKNYTDNDTTTAQPMELEYKGRKVENYPGQFENLVKERDNWRKMYDEELKKNEELGHKITLTNYDRDMKVKKFEKENEELKKENDEISRINSARGDELDRLRQRGTGLELENDELKTKLSLNEDMLSSRYSDIARLKKENNELSRINSVRLGDINRFQDKVDKLDGYLRSIDDAYSEIPVNRLRPGYYDGMTKFCNDTYDILEDWKKL